MSKDKIAGAVKEAGGKIRAAVDSATGDKKGEALGKKDQMTGNIHKNFGKLKDAFKK